MAVPHKALAKCGGWYWTGLAAAQAQIGIADRDTFVSLLLVVEPTPVGSSSTTAIHNKKIGINPNFYSGGWYWTRTNDLYDVNVTL